MPPKGPLTPERRQNPRHPVRPTEYIEIGDNNGGIILDISEGGMAVASAQALVGNQTLRFRFQLPRSLETIEASGEINWIGETKKRAGVRFVDLPPAAREQIQKWIDSQTSEYSNSDQKPDGSAVSLQPPKIAQEPVHQELTHEESTAAHNHSPSRNFNPFSPALSSSLDEPEIDESEPADEEIRSSGSNAERPLERRAQTRFPMTASTYVQLSDSNGGLMANLSKTGFSVRAAKTLETDQLPVVRFQLPNARDFVESSAWIVWKSPSKKTVGARFESLSDEAQSQIAQWIDSQSLPENAPIKNPLSPHLSVKSPVEQRAPKTPAPVTAVPVTLMSPDSVPIPSYISPLAISLEAQQEVPASNNPSATPSRAKVPPIASPSKPPLSAEKTLAPVPRIIPTPSSAKSAAVTSAPISPQSRKPLSASVPKTVAGIAPSNNAPNLASAAAFVPLVAKPPRSNLPGKSLPVQPSPDISKGLRNSWAQLAAAPVPTAPFVLATPVLPPLLNEPDWSVAPKRPTGHWKIAAMIVVIAATLFGAATLMRSKKSTTPSSQETAQNASAEASVPAATPSNDPVETSAVTNSAPTNHPTPSSTASTSNSASTSQPPREFYDAPRNSTPSSSRPKGDEQFVDEPRPSRSQSQISSPPLQSNSASRTASDQPASSVTPVQNGGERTQDQPTEEGSGFPEVVRRVQTAPAGFSNANGDSSSPQPTPSASRNQQTDANLASAAGVPQNSSATARPAAPTSANNSSPQNASRSVNPAQESTTAAVPASSTATAIPNPVPTVSVFSRFRAIRTSSDAPRPAGSDLQIGRLKSGPAPPYPIEAQRQQIQGTVELDVLVGADGNILSVHLVKGPPELASVAMGAVRSWQYGRTTLGGRPVETDQSIYFTFKLTK
jgi:protein TonB